LIDENSSIFMFCCFAFVFYNKREKKNIFKIEKKKDHGILPQRRRTSYYFN